MSLHVTVIFIKIFPSNCCCCSQATLGHHTRAIVEPSWPIRKPVKSRWPMRAQDWSLSPDDTWKTVLTSFSFEKFVSNKISWQTTSKLLSTMHILKIVNKGLLCKSADKYGMQKMGLEHRSSLNNRHCILCDLTTICSGVRRPGLTQFSCDCDYQLPHPPPPSHSHTAALWSLGNV